ncbi:MAG: LLM class flavin-dependent oxidoreductase [Blastocatellia bacterium]
MRINFGLALDFWSAAKPFRERLDEYAGMIELAEKYGFDAIQAGENRPQRPESGHVASPFLVLAALARSTKLQLGTGVALVTIQHPLQIAYDAVLLDHLTQGRFVFGMGLGSPPLMKRYGVNPDDAGPRMDELLPLLKAMWNGESRYEGRFFDVRGGVLPMPFTPGGPPMLIAGKVRRSAERAAEYGAGWYSATQYHLALITRQARIYREHLAALGKPVANGIVAINRTTFVAETDAAARRDGKPYVSQILNFYGSFGAITDAAGNPLPVAADLFETTGAEQYFCSSPETVRAAVQRYVDEAGVNQFNFRVAMGDMPVELIARTISLLGEQVLPYFRE